jgi:hypothetical protein
MSRAKVLGLAMVASLVAGCGSPTEIFVVVDSDVPAMLDTVTVLVTPPAGDLQSATGATADQPLPRTLGLVHETGPLGPVQVHVQGSFGGSLVIERRARLSFVEGKNLVLPIHLLGVCRGVSCPAPTTCDASGACVASDVDPNGLAEWNGTVPQLDGGTGTPDAGPPDATRDTSGMCTPTAETCNDADDDCDGSIDEDFDFSNDIDNCGFCGNRCRGGNAMCCLGFCERGACP